MSYKRLNSQQVPSQDSKYQFLNNNSKHLPSNTQEDFVQDAFNQQAKVNQLERENQLNQLNNQNQNKSNLVQRNQPQLPNTPRYNNNTQESFQMMRQNDPRIDSRQKVHPLQRPQDPRIQDPRPQEARLQDPRLQDPRIQEARLQEARPQEPRPQEPRLQEAQPQKLPSKEMDIKMQMRQKEEELNKMLKNVEEMQKKFQDDKNKLEQDVRRKMRQEINSELKETYNSMRQNILSDVENKKQMDKQQQINHNQNLTVEQISELYTNEADGFHLLEVNRLLKSDPSLTFEQAKNIANSNGCLQSGSNEMCPSKLNKRENFKEKGNCTNGKCKVQFEENNTIDKRIQELNIEFYSSTGCGFCSKSKELFTKHNIMNKVNLIENQPLPEGVRGYPHFHSKTTNKSHTGAPSSVEFLVNKLS